MSICKYYPLGQCYQGTKCINKHIGSVRATPCRDFVRDRCKYGLKCKFTHVVSPPAEDKNPVRPSCRDFLSEKSCKNGLKCYRWHDVTARTAGSAPIAATQSESATKDAPSIEKKADVADGKDSGERIADAILPPSVEDSFSRTVLSSASFGSVSTATSHADDTDHSPSKDVNLAHENIDLVHPTTFTEDTAVIDHSHDTSMSTVPDDESSNLFIVGNNNNESVRSTRVSSSWVTHLFPKKAMLAKNKVELAHPTTSTREASFIDHSNDTSLSTAPEDGSSSLLVEPTSVSPASSISVSLSRQVSKPLVKAKPTTQQEFRAKKHTVNQTTNELSREVVNWAATRTPSNHNMTGPGIYQRQVCFSEVLCRWPLNLTTPPDTTVDNLIELCLTFGDIVCSSIYRNTGSENTLLITFQNHHEAAAAAMALNGHFICAGHWMMTQVSVTHQIAVTYQVPNYIIEALAPHGLAKLHRVFEQSSCAITWNDHPFWIHADDEETETEVTIIGACEQQVSGCKAILEDLLSGKVLTREEEGNDIPLWHEFFETEEGRLWLRGLGADEVDGSDVSSDGLGLMVRVRVANLVNLKVLMVYGSSEWSRREVAGIVGKKIQEVRERDARAKALERANVSRELKAITWKGVEWSV